MHRLLTLLHELNRELGVSAGELGELQQIIDSRIADKKLAEASKFLPPSLIVDGANPLRLLYDGLSQGIHSMTDDECADTAAEMVVALEYLVTELGHQLKARHHFVGEIRKLAAKRSGSQAPSAPDCQSPSRGRGVQSLQTKKE